MYVADQRDAEKLNRLLQDSIQAGLWADVFHEDMPDELAEMMVKVHNGFHAGAATSFPEQLRLAPKARHSVSDDPVFSLPE